MNILGMPTYYKLIIKGLVIIAALGYRVIGSASVRAGRRA